MRSSSGVAVALIGGLACGSTLYALAAGIGALSTGFASLRGGYRTRAGAMLGTALGMAASAYVAGLAGSSTLAIVIAVALAGYAYGLFSCLGDAASGIGLNSTIAMIVLGSISTPSANVADVALFVLAGGLVQTVLAIAAWPVGRHSIERRALAAAYRDLAAFARSLRDDGGEPRLPSHDPLVAVRAALADPQPFGRRTEFVALQTLADEAERIRASLTVLSTSGENHDDGLPATTAELLEDIASALERARGPQDDAAWTRANEFRKHHPEWDRLYGQIRSAWRSASVPAPGGDRTALIDRSLVPHVERWWPIVRANVTLDSPFGRHAVRLAIALGLAMLLYRLAHIERGYWIALTAAIVMRPDFTTTLTRGFARIAGTIVGAGLASAVALVVPLTPRVDVTMAIASAAIGYVVFPVNFALYSVTLTAYVVFVLSLIGLSEEAATGERIVATCIGGALAMVAYGVWPTWESPLTRRQLSDLLELQRQFARALFDAYGGGAPIDPARMESLSTEVWKLRTRASESIERVLSEPESTHDIAPGDALAILAAEHRVAVANITLQDALSMRRGAEPLPAVRAFADAFDAAMRSVIAALRDGRAPEPFPPLREAYETLRLDLRDAKQAGIETLLAQCDLFADSVNTIAEQLR